MFFSGIFTVIRAGIVETTGISGVTKQRHREPALLHFIVCSRVRTQQQFMETEEKINLTDDLKYFQWLDLVSHPNYKHACLFISLSCDTIASYYLLCL